MDQETLTPTAIAAELGIQAITLRRWCSAFAAHLSPTANPGSGVARRFTGKDYEVLKQIKTLRENDRSLAEINDLLSGLTFAEIDDHAAHPADDKPATDTRQLDLAGLPNDSKALATQNIESIVMAEIASLRSEIIDIKRDNRGFGYGVGLGFVLALLFVVVILLLALIYGKV